jgi:hypothetical protein
MVAARAVGVIGVGLLADHVESAWTVILAGMTGDEDRDIPISFRFRYSLARDTTIFDLPTLNPSRWEGKKYRLSNNLFPLPNEEGAKGVGEGVGDPTDPLSVATPIFLYGMEYSARFQRGPRHSRPAGTCSSARRGRPDAGVEAGHDVADLHLAPKSAREMSLRSPRVRRKLGIRVADLGELADGVMGLPLSVTLAMACPRRPLPRKSAVGYHAAMRWILTTVLLAASALASALPTADPPATDDLSGLIG